MERMKNVLWLTEWFPTSIDPYNGDGIERRAKAVSLYNKVFIIYVKKNPHLKLGKIEYEERFYNENCLAFIYLYPSIKKFSPLLDFFLSNFYFISLHIKAFRKFRKKYGKPFGLQVNVAMKNGIIALFYKWAWRISYIVVEGWSQFLPEEKPQFKNKSWLFRLFARSVLKKSALVVTVSHHLGKMINQYVVSVPYQVIPSVVDQQIFFPAMLRAEKKDFRFIHISNLSRPKNMDQILIGFKKVLEKGYSAELILHVPFKEDVMNQVRLLKLEKNIVFKGEAKQNELADSIRSSDALILFSLYETFGNVIIEAQACGVPAITSNYPTFFEIIENHSNGIIAKGKTADDLADAIIQFIKNRKHFDCKAIADKAIENYSFEKVGKMFNDIYISYFNR